MKNSLAVTETNVAKITKKKSQQEVDIAWTKPWANFGMRKSKSIQRNVTTYNYFGSQGTLFVGKINTVYNIEVNI